MRKSLFILLASSALFSCSTEEVINVPTTQAIAFGNVFVENSTRAAEGEVESTFHETTSLSEFFVYGNIIGNVTDDNGNYNTVNIYNNAKVYKVTDEENETTSWNCDVMQFWVPNCSYEFVAISDVDNDNVIVTTENGLPSKIEYDVTCQKDLLYAPKNVTTNNTGKPATGTTVKTDENGNTYDVVAFSFGHLLSRVQFSFTNGFKDEAGVELAVTGIKITNVKQKGACSFDNESGWTWNFDENSSTTALTFGNAGAIDNDEVPSIKTEGGAVSSTLARLLIPGTQTFDISLTIKHNKGGNETNVEMTTGEITFLQGCSYNFTAVLNDKNVTGIVPITFDITNMGWGDDSTGNPNVGDYDNINKENNN